MINELISHLDKDSDDLDSSIEDIHWKTVESHVPIKSQDRKWITVGQATSLHSGRPRDSHNKEEELVIGLDLPSETEGLTQNGTESNTSSPVLKRRKFISADGTDISVAAKPQSGPHRMMPPSTYSKTPDSLSYYLPSSEQSSADDMHGMFTFSLYIFIVLVMLIILNIGTCTKNFLFYITATVLWWY